MAFYLTILSISSNKNKFRYSFVNKDPHKQWSPAAAIDIHEVFSSQAVEEVEILSNFTITVDNESKNECVDGLTQSDWMQNNCWSECSTCYIVVGSDGKGKSSSVTENHWKSTNSAEEIRVSNVNSSNSEYLNDTIPDKNANPWRSPPILVVSSPWRIVCSTKVTIVKPVA